MSDGEPGIQLVREGDYLAEVEVVFLDCGHPFSHDLSLEDMRRLAEVRAALKRGDVGGASAQARVYRLVPVEGAENPHVVPAKVSRTGGARRHAAE